MVPRDYIDADAHDAILAWSEFEAGVLPVQGGMLDQSAWFIEAVRFVRRLSAKHQHEQNRKMQADNKKLQDKLNKSKSTGARR